MTKEGVGPPAAGWERRPNPDPRAPGPPVLLLERILTMLVAGALRGQLSFLPQEPEGLCGQAPLSLKPVSVPSRAPRPQKPLTPCPAPCRALSRTLTQRRPVWFSTRSETLTADRLERLGRGCFWSSCPGWAGWGCRGGGRRASLGQSSAESHDGQAEEGAEIGRGLGWCVGRRLGLGAEAALLRLVAR